MIMMVKVEKVGRENAKNKKLEKGEEDNKKM